MEIVFRDYKIVAHRGTGPEWQDFYVKAVGYFEGIILHFGSYSKGACDTIIEDSTKVRCGYPEKQCNGVPLKTAVEILEQDFYNKLRRTGLSMPEVIDNFNRTRLGAPKTFVHLWRISLLIG